MDKETFLKKDIERISDGILDNKLNLNSIPEGMFVGYFLPKLAGLENVDSNDGVLLDRFKVSGGPTSGVNILNENGEIVLTTPPIINNESLGVVEEDPNSPGVMDLINYGNKLVDSGHSMENPYFKKVESMIPVNTLENTWEKVFEHYGFKPVEEVVDSSSSDDDMFVYD